MLENQQLSIQSLFSVGQIRLSELSVFNWGSFNGLHTASIDPFGTLITGDNGSGKSTFIDGLMALLLPAGRAMFNVAAAQGDRLDRSLLSYMRGSFGSVHDGASTRVKSKRESAVVTGLRALFKGDDNSQITLAALFWTMQPTNVLADVTRLYVVAKRDLSLKEMLDAFGEGNTRMLKQRLRDDPAITCCDANFSDYQELYRKLLYMDNKNAPALLSRALGLKKIDNLTELIRDLVLEPSTAKDDAKKVVDEFSDLVAIHNQLVDARAQKNHLSKLPEFSMVIEKSRQELEELLEEKNNLLIYFGEVFSQLWGEKIKAITVQLEAIFLNIKQTELQEQDANALVERRHEEYLQLGGDKIEGLRKEIGHVQDKLNRVIRDSSQYQENAGELGIPVNLDEQSFIKNQSEADLKLVSVQIDKTAAQDKFAVVSGEYSELQSNIRSITEEIAEIEARPDSNIDIKYQRLRDELIDSLGLSKDQCLFIGELVDVQDEECHWQGAIERALGGLRITLVAPQDCYSMVTRWLNARHTGLHVRVQIVDVINLGKSKALEFKANGYLRKLVWREHPYREWLKIHLQRFDLQCVSNTEELDITPFSMTQQGLMHLEKGRFEKKDQHKIDDRRQWNLGFSNKPRLAILNQEKNTLIRSLATTEKRVKEARQGLEAISIRIKLWEKIKAYVWDDVNAPYYHEKLTYLKRDLQTLEQAGGSLETAKSRWESAKSDLGRIQEKLKELSSERGGVSNILENARGEHGKAQADAAKGLPDKTRSLLLKRIGVLTIGHLDQKAEIIAAVDKKLETLLETSRRKQKNAEISAIGIMSLFRSHEKWQVFAVDWQNDIPSLPSYLKHLEQLENEGLPNLVEQFVERLNKHATQSLARIKTKLESEREDIVERIEVINRVLKRTEFRSGSYLKLGSKKDKYPHVSEFESQLLNVLSQATSPDHEARFQQLVKVVGMLEKASAPSTSNTLESMRLLDPRYQMSFYAEELDVMTNEVRDVLASSSGKSGGEKESFAGTIVAASLAYVLTPDGCDTPIYSTVFLDEAFSNTAETVSRRVLRIFRELHLHVNLITPYKNLNLARESARTLLIVERDAANHDSRFCEITWEELDQKMSEKNRKLLTEAVNLGVEISN